MGSAGHEVDLSVVVPVYGCAGALGTLVDRIAESVAPITSSYEIVLVDDASPDHAWEKIVGLAAANSHVRGLKLSRNFGQHAALTAALAESRGRWTIAMDCDLQDPPEEIPRLYAKALEGYDVVLARRVRRGHSRSRRLAAAAYFALLRFFTKTDIRGEYGTFSIVSRPVVDAFLQIRDRGRHYLFALTWLGFHRGEIDIVQAERHDGAS